MTDQEIAEKNEIIRAVVGSTVHGLAIEGTDDRDEMGVFIEPPEYVCSLAKIIDAKGREVDQWVYRTQPEGVRSGPGDVDRTIYSLRKYARLAAVGNPSILVLLFAPGSARIIDTALGQRLLELAPAFVSRQAGERFLKYMQAQRDRMLGRRGQARLPNRPELVERYGYDVKYAAHMIRLAYQGVELLSTGRFSLPMPSVHRDLILRIRLGDYTLPTVLRQADYLERALIKAMENTKLSEHPDYDMINRVLVRMHIDHWRQFGYI